MKQNNHRKRLVVDLDDCLSFTTDRDFENAKPNDNLIDKLITLKEIGYEIYIRTARGQVSCNGDAKAAQKKYGKQITNWLKKNRVPYDELSFEKPLAIYYIDDKAIRPEEFILLNISEIQGGMSGAVVELHDNVIIKTEKSVEAAINVCKWYDHVKHLLPTPEIHSLIDSSIKMEYIPVAEEADFRHLLTYLTIFKNSDSITERSWDCFTYFDRIHGHMKECRDLFDPKHIAFIREMFEHFHEFLNEQESLCHGDYSLDNALPHEGNGITYLIDPIFIPSMWSSYLLDLGKLAHSCRRYRRFDYMAMVYQFAAAQGVPNFVTLFMEVCQWIRILKYCNKEDYMIYGSTTKVLINQMQNSFKSE